jgi:hypothetical protein
MGFPIAGSAARDQITMHVQNLLLQSEFRLFVFPKDKIRIKRLRGRCRFPVAGLPVWVLDVSSLHLPMQRRQVIQYAPEKRSAQLSNAQF